MTGKDCSTSRHTCRQSLAQMVNAMVDLMVGVNSCNDGVCSHCLDVADASIPVPVTIKSL